jgi:hypothetical protein
MHDESREADNGDPGSIQVDADIVQAPLVTVPLSSLHKTDLFTCSRSSRVQRFFSNEAVRLVPHYCRAFIATDPEDAAIVWGYYTLSASQLHKANLSGTDEKRVTTRYMGYPAPMVRIGFLGRDDRATKGLGSVLLVDAAIRVSRNPDIAAWGLVLDCEGGQENKTLWAWYLKRGFKACRDPSSPRAMYAPLSAFLPPDA